MKVSAILKGKKDEFNRKTVYIRTNIGEKRTFRATKIKLTKDQLQNGKVTGHPIAKELNNLIRDYIIEAEYGHLKKIGDYPDADLRTYMEKCIRQWSKEKEQDTLDSWERSIKHFLEWHGREIRLSQISVELLNEFKSYLNKKYNGSNNVWKICRNLRTLFTRAGKEKIIKDDPFDVFDRPQYKQTKRNYLTKPQVQKLEEYIDSDKCPDILKPYGYWFLIGCYTGLRFGDMCQFNKRDHIKGDRLTLHTLKTGEIVSIPFNDKLKDLFKKVDYKPLERSNQKMNENLKIFMNACDIDINLTAHVARHTFAVMCADAGIPIEVTAKLLAQKSIKSTSIYYKITDKKTDAEFGKLF